MHVQVKITSESVDQTELSMVVQSCIISDSHVSYRTVMFHIGQSRFISDSHVSYRTVTMYRGKH